MPHDFEENRTRFVESRISAFNNINRLMIEFQF